MKAEDLVLVEDGKLFLNQDGEKRELGEIKDSPEQAIAYYLERFNTFTAKVEETLEKLSKDANKGSYIGKLDSLMAKCSTEKAVGDFSILFEKLETAKAEVEETIQVNRKKNTELKTELIERAEKVVQAEDWIVGVEEIKAVRQSWMVTGKAEGDDEMRDKFDGLVTQFYDEHKRLLSLKSDLKNLRIEELERIIKALASYDPKTGWDEYNALRDAWRKVEHVPSAEYKPLFEKYKEVSKEVEQQIKATRKSNPKKTSEGDAKAALLKEIVGLREDYSPECRTRLMQIQNEWKSLPRHKSDFKYLGAFKEASDFLFESLRLDGQCDKRSLEGADRVKEKTRLIRRSLKMDKEELLRLEDSPFAGVGGGKNAFSKRLREIESKIKVKEEILAGLS